MSDNADRGAPSEDDWMLGTDGHIAPFRPLSPAQMERQDAMANEVLDDLDARQEHA